MNPEEYIREREKEFNIQFFVENGELGVETYLKAWSFIEQSIREAYLKGVQSHNLEGILKHLDSLASENEKTALLIKKALS